MTTSTGAWTRPRDTSAGEWFVRVVSENARAYPGRPIAAVIAWRYASKSAGRRPAFSRG